MPANGLLWPQVPWKEEGAAAVWPGTREHSVPTTSLAGPRSECGAGARPSAGAAMPGWGRGALWGRGGCELPSSPHLSPVAWGGPSRAESAG